MTEKLSNILIYEKVARSDLRLVRCALLPRVDIPAARAQGCVPLPGRVGYGATVWDLLPTYPPRITEHGAPGGSDLTPQNYGT